MSDIIEREGNPADVGTLVMKEKHQMVRVRSGGTPVPRPGIEHVKTDRKFKAGTRQMEGVCGVAGNILKIGVLMAEGVGFKSPASDWVGNGASRYQPLVVAILGSCAGDTSG